MFAITFSTNFSPSSPLDDARIIDAVQGDVCIPPLVFTNELLQTAFQKLKVDTAAGPDNIPTSFLIHCQNTIIPYLTPIFNDFLSTSFVPDTWRLAIHYPHF